MALSFERDIRPLFRESDRRSMKWRFDLCCHPDVQANASTLLGRLEEGTMPCDRSWPHADVEKLSRWIDEGMIP
jgi:hypothetical protein